MDGLTLLLSLLFATIACIAWYYGSKPTIADQKGGAENAMASSNISSDLSWTFVYKKDNIYVSQKKEVQSDFFAFRGEMISTLSVNQILGAFVNASHTLKWADKLSQIEVLPKLADASSDDVQRKPNKGFSFPKLFGKKAAPTTDQTNLAIDQLKSGLTRAEDVVYQVYKMWPLPPRDFVFNRTILLEASHERVTILYTTMDDVRKPKQKGWVRTEAPYTIWTFQSYNSFCNIAPIHTHSNKQQHSKKTHTHSKSHLTQSNLRPSLCTHTSPQKLTYVSLQSFVLMDDIQLPWLINYIQRSWPYNTLKMFIEHAQDQGLVSVEQKTIDWE